MSQFTAVLYYLPLIALLALGAAELRWPWRTAQRGRWAANLGLGLLNIALLAILPWLGANAAAHSAAQHGWGLLRLLPLPSAVSFALAVLLLDLAVYGQHRLMHQLPLLWRLHRVHHSDVALDASSGLRFHPLEAVLSALYKSAITVALGASPAAVALAALLLTVGSLFNHSNITLPGERWLRALLVTPRMHRIHHSSLMAETNSNYGTFLPWWDILLGSYCAQAAAGEQAVHIGLTSHRHPQEHRFWALLKQPFLPKPP